MKIIDRREIEFDPRSVVKAITTSPKAARGFGLPGLSPTDVRFHPKEGTVDVIYGTQHSARAVAISAEALGAILVSYCVRTHIPMPKNAEKAIRIEAKSAVLAFRLKFEEAPSPEAAEGPSRAAETVTSWTWLRPEQASVPRK
jgi:hypothetical protein